MSKQTTYRCDICQRPVPQVWESHRLLVAEIRGWEVWGYIHLAHGADRSGAPLDVCDDCWKALTQAVIVGAQAAVAARLETLTK